MPFKSKAQRRKFAHLYVEGKITDEQYERWNRTTGRKELPERVKAKKTKRRATSGSKKTRRATSRKARRRS